MAFRNAHQAEPESFVDGKFIKGRQGVSGTGRVKPAIITQQGRQQQAV